MMDDGMTRNLLTGINAPLDSRNLTDLEKTHLPWIFAPPTVKLNEPFDVTVEVGRLRAHPIAPGHFIWSIELYADETRLAKVEFPQAASHPAVKLRVSLPFPAKELRVYPSCSMHGTWVGRRPITVVA